MPTMVTPIGHGALPIAISRYASLACEKTVRVKTTKINKIYKYKSMYWIDIYRIQYTHHKKTYGR